MEKMTLEKLELLRQWIRSEIDYKIIEDNIAPYTTASPSSKYRDELFQKIMKTFCEVDK